LPSFKSSNLIPYYQLSANLASSSPSLPASLAIPPATRTSDLTLKLPCASTYVVTPTQPEWATEYAPALSSTVVAVAIPTSVASTPNTAENLFDLASGAW